MKKIINTWIGKEGYNCFGCCPDNPYGVKLEFYEDGDDIVSFWKPGKNYQGWVKILHGGIQAVLLDEVCAWVILRKLQTCGMTMKMETKYMHPVETDDPQITIRAHLVETKHNIAIIEASITNNDGEICTKAKCTYFTFSHETAVSQFQYKPCLVEGE